MSEPAFRISAEKITPPYCAFVPNFAADQLVHPLQADRDIENPLLFREPTVPRDRFGQPDDDRRGRRRIRELRHPQHDGADTRTMALVRGSTSISYSSWPSTTHFPRFLAEPAEKEPRGR